MPMAPISRPTIRETNINPMIIQFFQATSGEPLLPLTLNLCAVTDLATCESRQRSRDQDIELTHQPVA